MKNEDIKLLEDNGWEVECESPFEISHEHCDATATGYAAEIVLNALKDEMDNAFSEQDMHDCFNAGVNRGVTIAAIITKHDLGEEFPSYGEYMKKHDEPEELDISGMLADNPKQLTEHELKEIMKSIREHEKEIERRTGMTYEDWQQTIGLLNDLKI